MRQFLQWCGSLLPMAAQIAIVMWIGFVAMSVIGLAKGSFGSMRSAADVAYIVCVFASLPVIAGLLCAVLVDAWLRICAQLGWFR